jgi:Zn-dependent M28 family amino/carboxypeptidase
MAVMRVIVVALLLVVWLAGCVPAKPPEAPAGPPAPAIPFTMDDGSNALARVRALCALGARDAGTPGGARAAAWIAAELERLGLAPHVDLFTNDTPSGPLVCRNVTAEIPPAAPPAQPPATIVLLSHFDTKSGISADFVGANDGGSSTALLLELARVIRASPLRRHRVRFGFVDGEECRVEYGPRDGFHGSRRLAAQCVASGTVLRGVILLDMIGDADLTVTLPRNGDPALTLLALQSAAAVGARRRFQLADHSILDDHQPFLDAGIAAVDLIDFRYGSAPGLNDYWHTPRDLPDKLSAESLTVLGRVVTEMLRQLDAR